MNMPSSCPLDINFFKTRNTSSIFSVTLLSGCLYSLELLCWSLSFVRLFETPLTVACRLLCPRDSPGENTEWVAIPFSRESSRPRDRTWVFFIAVRFFTGWITREAQQLKNHPSVHFTSSCHHFIWIWKKRG